MKRKWQGVDYSTDLKSNNDEGWVALELHKGDSVAGRIVFWDSEGQFSVQISADELPLGIVEEFIAEAKSKIKVS